MSREIPLGRGKAAIVDSEDYQMLSRYRWYYMPPGKRRSGSGYAACRVFRTTRYMHRVLMLSPPAGQDVDHVNGDGLDNRRENLRVVPHQKNCCARHRLHKQNKTGVAGVFYEEKIDSWRAYIDNNGRRYLGRFKTKEEAVNARKMAEV